MKELKYNLDFNIRYNDDAARMGIDDFENAHHIIKKGNRNTDYMVVFSTRASAQKPMFTQSALRRMKKAELVDLAYLLDLRVILDQTKQALIDDLITITREQYYDALCDRGHDEELDYHTDFTANGYSQGAVIRVVNPDNLKHITHQYIENLYFDTPIYACVDIYDEDGELLSEVYLDEYMDTPYDLNKDSLIENLKTVPTFENLLVIEAIGDDETVLNVNY